MTDYHYYITSLETVLKRHLPANRYSLYKSEPNAVCLTEEIWESSFFPKMTMWRVSAPNEQDYLYDEAKDACLRMIDLLMVSARDTIVQEFWREIEKSRYVNSAKNDNDRALTDSINDLIVDCKMISLLLRKGFRCEARDAKTLLELFHNLEESLMPSKSSKETFLQQTDERGVDEY